MQLRFFTIPIPGGVEVSTEGDSFFWVFESARTAVSAAASAQRALAVHDWPEGRPVRVRMGLHTGEGVLGRDNYVGLDVHRAARIAAAGHGGQVLLSSGTHGLVANDLPAGVSVVELGHHHLKDLLEPEGLYQLAIRGLEADFPPISTLDTIRSDVPRTLTSFVGRGSELEAVLSLVGTTVLVDASKEDS